MTEHRLDSCGFQYTGTTHQAVVNGGGAETFCGEWVSGDRMSLWSEDVTCQKCRGGRSVARTVLSSRAFSSVMRAEEVAALPPHDRTAYEEHIAKWCGSPND